MSKLTTRISAADVRAMREKNPALGMWEAAHIVKCVNMHDELLQMIRTLQEVITQNNMDDSLEHAVYKLLAKAEAE